MRRNLLLIPALMLVCLILVPTRKPLAFSSSAPAPKVDFVDDGKKLSPAEEFVRLAKSDAPAFLQMCMRRYEREITGYTGTLIKQERIADKLHPEETIDFWFREKPNSVVLKWKKGERQACSSMFVEGENNDKVLVLPKIIRFTGRLVERDPEGRDAKTAGRYSMREFSLLHGTERTYKAWKASQDRGDLHVEYLGLKKVPELDGRECHVLRRTCCTPEEDGVVTIEINVDAETWLQTGSKLLDGRGELIAKYYLTRLQLNPEFDAKCFTKDFLRK